MNKYKIRFRDPEVEDIEFPSRNLRPFRIARTPRAKGFVAEVLHQMKRLEDLDRRSGRKGARVRKRRTVDETIFRQQVESLACDLAYQHTVSPWDWVRVARWKKVLENNDRYQPWFFTGKLVHVMDMMARPELRFCVIELGYPGFMARGNGRMTLLKAGSGLAALIQRFGLSRTDFGMHEGEEVIVLKESASQLGVRARWRDYIDTPQTLEMRGQVRRINRALEEADIEYDGSLKGIDIHARRLRRVFLNSSFEQHGRMYGGFWLQLSGEERAQHLTIGGSSVVGLDYGQMGVRLLYAELGLQPHFDDAYAVPGLEAHREGVKKILNAMIASRQPLIRCPQGARSLLPRGESATRVMERISEFHAPLRPQFHQGSSLRLMYRESQIMVQVLLRLIGAGITALPVHDGLWVAEEHEQQARRAMHECFREATGVDGVVMRSSACPVVRPTGGEQEVVPPPAGQGTPEREIALIDP